MKKTIKTITALMLVLCIIIGAVVLNVGVPTNEDGEKTVGVVAYAACQVQRGGFNGNNYSTKQAVYIKNTRTWNGKTATAKVRICTFNSSGIRTPGYFTILITTPYDRNYKRTWSGKSTNDLVLSGAYDTYYIQIKRNGTGSTNVANCYWWSYDAKSNCKFW